MFILVKDGLIFSQISGIAPSKVTWLLPGAAGNYPLWRQRDEAERAKVHLASNFGVDAGIVTEITVVWPK